MKQRIIETNEGIQGEGDVALFDQMQRHLRDKNWIGTDQLIAFGIDHGLALEIGPGPGYLGLEWLKKTVGTRLKAVEISQNMIETARKNAAEYGFLHRVEYRCGTAEDIPFEDETFDAVFTNGSLHEWSKPERAFDEIYRVLKQNGKYVITDLRRDINPVVSLFLKLSVKPPEMKQGLKTSIAAAYTRKEIEKMIAGTQLKSAGVKKSQFGLQIAGKKDAPARVEAENNHCAENGKGQKPGY